MVKRKLEIAERDLAQAKEANRRQENELRLEIVRLRDSLDRERADSLGREAHMGEVIADAQREIEALNLDLEAAEAQLSGETWTAEAQAGLGEIEAALGMEGSVLGLEVRPLPEGGAALMMPAARLFDDTLVGLRPEAKAPLAALGALLAERSGEWRFAVTGHADATPIKNLPYKDNTELSFHRAHAVARFLALESPLPARSLEVRSLGEFAPLFAEDAPRARLNRRVEIIPIPLVRPDGLAEDAPE